MAFTAAYAGVLGIALNIAPYTLPLSAHANAQTWFDSNSGDATIGNVWTNPGDITQIRKALALRCNSAFFLQGDFNLASASAGLNSLNDKSLTLNNVTKTLWSEDVANSYYRTGLPLGAHNVGVATQTIKHYADVVNDSVLPTAPTFRYNQQGVRLRVDGLNAADPKEIVFSTGITTPIVFGVGAVELIQRINAGQCAAVEAFGQLQIVSLNLIVFQTQVQVYSIGIVADGVVSTLSLSGGPAGSDVAFQNPAQYSGNVAASRVLNNGYVFKLITPVFGAMGSRFIYINANLTEWYDIQLQPQDAAGVVAVASAAGSLSMGTEGRWFYKVTSGPANAQDKVYVSPGPPSLFLPQVIPTRSIPHYSRYDVPEGIKS